MKPIIGIAAMVLLGLGLTATSPAQSISSDPPISTQTPIILLVDMQSGQTLFAQNADRRFVPASITKVMSAYVAFEMLEHGDLDPDQLFTFSPQAAKDWYHTGSTMFIERGETLSVDRLLRGITSVSANDASIVLAEGAAGSVDKWVALMNETAAQLGMRNSHFGTPNGWPDDGKTFTTARDLELLAEALITRHPGLYAQYFGKPGLRHNGFAQANHDPISGRVKGADGIKTGFTNQSGHGFLGSAKRGGTRLIMVLGGEESEQGRAAAARGLIEWGFSGFDRAKLFAREAIVGDAKVQDGERATVALKTGDPAFLAIPGGNSADVTMSIQYHGPLAAPIHAGDEVAELRVSGDGIPTAQIPLFAASDINQANALTRIQNAFVQWFN